MQNKIRMNVHYTVNELEKTAALYNKKLSYCRRAAQRCNSLISVPIGKPGRFPISVSRKPISYLAPFSRYCRLLVNVLLLRCWVPLFNAFVWGHPLNLRPPNLVPRNLRLPGIMWWKPYFDICSRFHTKHGGVTDERTDEIAMAKTALR